MATSPFTRGNRNTFGFPNRFGGFGSPFGLGGLGRGFGGFGSPFGLGGLGRGFGGLGSPFGLGGLGRGLGGALPGGVGGNLGQLAARLGGGASAQGRLDPQTLALVTQNDQLRELLLEQAKAAQRANQEFRQTMSQYVAEGIKNAFGNAFRG